jgi:hypothetical protein
MMLMSINIRMNSRVLSGTYDDLAKLYLWTCAEPDIASGCNVIRMQCHADRGCNVIRPGTTGINTQNFIGVLQGYIGVLKASTLPGLYTFAKNTMV